MKNTGTKIFLITFVLLLLAGCGGGGGGSNSTNGSSNWDEMTWNQDNWG